MSDGSIDLDPADLLAAIHRYMDEKFFAASKSNAKKDFRELASGKSLPFMTISAGDDEEVVCELALDHGEFIGKLNFSRFRDALAAQQNRIAVTLNTKGDMNILTNEENGDTLFYIPGAVEENGVLNVLVVAVEQRKAGAITIRLMFLDPTNLSIKTH